MFFHGQRHIAGMGGPIDVKRKGAWVGYWVNYVTLIFDPTHDLDLWFFKVKFLKSCISGIVIWLMWNKKKAHQLDTGLTPWSCPLNTPMTLILCKFQGQSLKYPYLRNGRADWHGMKVMWVIHYHDCDLWVTMVGGWTYWTGETSDVGVRSTYLVLLITILRLICKDAFRWMPWDLIDDKSILV